MATPTLNSVSPNPIPASNSAQTIKLFGTNFASGDTLLFTFPEGTTGANAKPISVISTAEIDYTQFNDLSDVGIWKVQVRSPDGTLSNAVSFTVSIANAAPVISAPGSVTVQQNQASSISGLSISDSDAVSANETIAVVIGDLNGTFFASGTGVSGSGTKQLTITGPLSQVNNALASVTDLESGTSNDTVTIVANDSRNGTATPATINVAVNPQNAAPVISAPGSVTVQQNQASSISGLSISDSDAVSANETIAVVIGDLNGTFFASGTGVSGSGTKQLTITGPLSQVNNALASVTDLESGTSNDTVTIVANDSRNGTATPATINVAVNPQNAAPVISAPGSVTVQQNQASSISGLSISDSDAVSANETIAVVIGDLNGTLFASGTGVSGSGTKQLTITGPLSQVNNALASVTDLESGTSNDTVTIVANDSRNGTALPAIINVRVSTIGYSVSPSTAVVNENQGALTFTISRQNSSGSETVYVSTLQDQGYHNAPSGTASTNYYYSGLANVAYTFQPGQSSIQVPIAIYDRGLTSGSEKFSFEVQSATGSNLAASTFTIVNNDAISNTYSVSPSPAAFNENAGTAIFTVTRANSSQQQSIEITTVQDQGYFNAASGTTSTNYYYDELNHAIFSFAASQSSISIPITLHDRGLTTGSEKFSLDVQSAGANLTSTTFKIFNNDPAPNPAQPSPTDIAPTISGPSSVSVFVNDTVHFSGLVGTDSDGYVASYQLQLTSGSGTFTLDGKDSGSSVKVSAALLHTVGFSTGSSPGTEQIQVYAIDDQGKASAALGVSVNVSARSGSASAPTADVLADLSRDVYYIPKGADGYSVVPYDALGDKNYFNIDGFFATAYGNSDGSQIVVAMEGTDVGNINNLYADGSWAKSGVTATLQKYFEDAVRFLLSVEDAHPGANIQLTGHSLAGALAELLGEASHRKVTAFDAPGAQQFYQTLLTGLASDDSSSYLRLTSEAAQRLPQTDTNFRLYADPVSTVGTPIGTTITLQNPSPYPRDLAPLDNHSIDVLANQVEGYVAGLVQQVPDDVDEPNNWGSILQVAQFGGALGKTGDTAGGVLTALIEGFHQWWVDPTGASDFVFTSNAGSPAIVSIQLPILPGVQSYEVRYQTGSSWSAFQQVWPEQSLAVGPGVNGVEFVPLELNWAFFAGHEFPNVWTGFRGDGYAQRNVGCFWLEFCVRRLGR